MLLETLCLQLKDVDDSLFFHARMIGQEVLSNHYLTRMASRTIGGATVDLVAFCFGMSISNRF
jgi:hypothetical protein